MKILIHKIMMWLIPWKRWSWRQTSLLMRINFWSNRQEFERLALRGSDHLTQREMDRARREGINR